MTLRLDRSRRCHAIACVAALATLCLAPPLLAQAAGAGRQPMPVVPSSPTAAQSAAEAVTGRRMTNLELSDAIRTSGLSQGQIRDRLARAGFDPSLADPFFAADSTAPEFLAASANTLFASALGEIGVLGGASETPADAVGAAPRMRRGASGVFGKDLFGDMGGSLGPSLGGPVDPSYRLGAGDQLQVVLTGEVEAVFQQLDVRRDGTVLLPQVGQVAVAGLTMEAARTLLTTRAAQIYSGIPSGRTKLDLSLTRIRTIQVYLVGEVELPGAVQVNALSTVFAALQRGGGPTDRGTFRQIEVRRANRVVQSVDLYNYLLAGDAAQDVRLEQGDIVFVRLGTRFVTVRGGVRRPARFELRGDEDFRDLIRFAGGLAANASNAPIQVDRILDPAQREPGKERVLLDVAVDAAQTVFDTVTVRDGDIVTVPEVNEERRNVVTVEGQVNVPGRYQWTDGMTVGDLLARAQGTLPWALTDRAKLFRLVPNTGRRELLSLDLREAAPRATALAEYDSLVVLDARLLHPSERIRVSGSVHRPGIVPFAAGQTLRDLVDLAGGLMEEAAIAEVARMVRRDEYTDTSAVLFRFDVRGTDPAWQSFAMERGDVISVRAKPGYRDAEAVTLAGEFRAPGIYAIGTDFERISQVIARAGGLLPTAAPEAFQLIRDGRVVAVDLARALAGSRRDDLQLRPGDRLLIARGSNTVRVSGAVRREVMVPFDPGWGLGDYISAAGGYGARADRGGVFVEYLSGKVADRRRFLGLTVADPRIRPGTSITVPLKEERDSSWKETLATVAQATSVLVSLVLAWNVVKRN